MFFQNRVGIGGDFFLISLLKTTPNCPQKTVLTKIHAPKKIVKGRSQTKSFYFIFFKIDIKNLGSGIQMVGKPKILADKPKCRARLSAG